MNTVYIAVGVAAAVLVGLLLVCVGFVVVLVGKRSGTQSKWSSQNCEHA